MYTGNLKSNECTGTVMTAVLGRKGQGSRKISGHTTANSYIEPKLLANNTEEFASLRHNNI